MTAYWLSLYREIHDEDKLAARVRDAEHRVYPLALALVAAGRTRVDGDRVLVDGAAFPADTVVSPRP